MTHAEFKTIVPGNLLKLNNSDHSIEVIEKHGWVNLHPDTVIACNGVAHFAVNIGYARDYQITGDGKKTICNH